MHLKFFRDKKNKLLIIRNSSSLNTKPEITAIFFFQDIQVLSTLRSQIRIQHQAPSHLSRVEIFKMRDQGKNYVDFALMFFIAIENWMNIWFVTMDRYCLTSVQFVERVTKQVWGCITINSCMLGWNLHARFVIALSHATRLWQAIWGMSTRLPNVLHVREYFQWDLNIQNTLLTVDQSIRKWRYFFSQLFFNFYKIIVLSFYDHIVKTGR